MAFPAFNDVSLCHAWRKEYPNLWHRVARQYPPSGGALSLVPARSMLFFSRGSNVSSQSVLLRWRLLALFSWGGCSVAFVLLFARMSP